MIKQNKSNIYKMGKPYGSENWIVKTAKKSGLEATTRRRGRIHGVGYGDSIYVKAIPVSPRCNRAECQMPYAFIIFLHVLPSTYCGHVNSGAIIF